MEETIAGEIEAQARRQGYLSRVLQNLKPHSGLFTVSSDDPDGVDPELREDGYGSRRIGCWILLRMLKAIEGKRPDEARWMLDQMADEVREKWSREIAAHSQFRVVRLAEIPPKPVEWVLEPLWPRGELTIIDGDPDAGKSWLWMAFAAGLTGSKVCPLPAGLKATGTSQVLLLTTEDDRGKAIRPRLEVLGADLNRIKVLMLKLDEDGFITASEVSGVVNFLYVMPRKPDVAIIDPLTLYSASDPRLNTDKANHVRRLLSPLIKAARKHNFALVVTRHFGKTPGKSIYRGIGSIDYVAAARSVIVVGKDSQDATERVRQVAHAKSNLGPKMQGGLQFVLDENLTPPFQWVEPSEGVSAEGIANPEAAEVAQEERSKLREAEEFLDEVLRGGGMEIERCRQQARALGIADRTLRRARESKGIKREWQEEDGRWWWFFPGERPTTKGASP